jgi:hypothetical protein
VYFSGLIEMDPSRVGRDRQTKKRTTIIREAISNIWTFQFVGMEMRKAERLCATVADNRRIAPGQKCQKSIFDVGILHTSLSLPHDLFYP